MVESIIASFRFEGKAGPFGWFDTPMSTNTFTAQSDVILSASRVTVVGQINERSHEVTVSISPGMSMRGVAMDKKPAIFSSISTFARLRQGDTCEVSLSSGGFQEGETVVVTLDVLALDTTVGEVTRVVLQEAEAEGANAVAFGISEASFGHFIIPHRSPTSLEIGPVRFLLVKLNVKPLSFPWFPIAYLDADTEELVFAGNLEMVFTRIEDPSPFPPAVAVVMAQVQVRCRPAMVTTTNDTLQLQFRSAEVLGSASINITDLAAIILAGFGTEEGFRQAVAGYLNDIVISSKTSPLGFVIPAYLESRPLPDYWHRAINMRLDFADFKYKVVHVHGLPITYLFLVFTMHSLGLPPPCFCEEPGPITKDDGDDTILSADNALRLNTRQGRELPDEWKKVLKSGQRTDYTPILAPAQLAAFGISQNAFREVAKPYARAGDHQNKSTSFNAAVYASVQFSWRAELESLTIEADGIKAVIDLSGEGVAKAAVRDKCKRDVLSVSERLRIALQDSSISWRLAIKTTPKEAPRELEMSIQAMATARLGTPDVDLDITGIPPPLDQAINWFIEKVIEGVKGGLSKAASDQLTIRLVTMNELNDSSIRLRYVHHEFFAGEAAVVLGHLFSMVWR
ncbi:hypothetical protein QBC34DRAFT_384855 [Podospora aff. communis PSN243]|uniref:Uncharacterized protein n=1 Tax=Podospora aff. communis PSN243 TaxID=3040156 RepID=A0AAV9G9K4_9PEZI|nr:hypothetical protein QBC34DRAFT_384855 [Podospora aff. communis PSN243]